MMKNIVFYSLLLFVLFAMFSCKSKRHSQKAMMNKREMEMRSEIEKEKRESEQKEKSIKKFELPDEFEATDSAAVNPSLGGFVSPTFLRKVDKEAEYVFGTDSFNEYINKNYLIPEKVISNGMGLRIVWEFTVDVNGNSSNFKQLNENKDSPEAFIELVKTVQSLKWKPAELNGVKVNSYKTMSIELAISK